MARSLHAHRPEFLWLQSEQGLRTAGILIFTVLLIAIVVTGVVLVEQTSSLLPRP